MGSSGRWTATIRYAGRRIVRDGCIIAQRVRKISVLKAATALIEPRGAVSGPALPRRTPSPLTLLRLREPRWNDPFALRQFPTAKRR